MEKNDLVAVERQLFNTVDKLRGYYDFKDIQNILLSVLYLKYINDKKNLDNIIIPEEAGYESLLKTQNNIGDNLTKAFQALETKNDIYSDIFSSFDFYGDKEDILSDVALKELVISISSINFSLLNLKFSKLFDSVLFRFTKIDNKSGNQYLQPRELTELMTYFISPAYNKNIFNPFTGLGSFAIYLNDSKKFIGQEIDPKITGLAKLRLIVHGYIDNFHLSTHDCLTEFSFIKNDQFDSIIFTPPFNFKINQAQLKSIKDKSFFLSANANSYIVSECFKKLKPNGRMVFLMPNGFLTSQNKKDIELRKSLIEYRNIEQVILLPSNIFGHTAIPVNIIVISKKAENKNISLIDASECYSENSKHKRILDLDKIFQILNSNDSSKFKRNVELAEFKENDYSLYPPRYLAFDFIVDTNIPYIRLGNVLKYIPPKRPNPETVGRLIRIKDLSGLYMPKVTYYGKLKSEKLGHNAALLSNNTLLLATRWKSLKPTYFVNELDAEFYYAFRDILAFKIDESKIDTEYLIIELNKEYVLKQFSSLSGGATIPYISRKDLLHIKIHLPSMLQQREMVSEYKNSIIIQKEKEIDAQKQMFGLDIADENSFLRHKIAGRFKNVRSAFKSIQNILNEIAKEDSNILNRKLTEKSNLTMSSYIIIMDRDLEYINQSLRISGTEILESDSITEKINIIDFVSNYCDELDTRKSKGFKVEFLVDDEFLAGLEDKSFYISGDPGLIRLMFDNIVENAEKYGFNNTISTRNILDVYIMFNFEEMEVQIDFSNTGNPLSKDFTFSSYIRKGSKSAKSNGEGIGGWMINEIMKKHGGRLMITDETKDNDISEQLVTTVELTFPIIIE